MNNGGPVSFSIRTVPHALSYAARKLHEGEIYMEESRNVTQTISFDYYVTPHTEYSAVCGATNYVNIIKYKIWINYLTILKFLP